MVAEEVTTAAIAARLGRIEEQQRLILTALRTLAEVVTRVAGKPERPTP